MVIVIIVYSLPQAGQSSKPQSSKRNDIAHIHAVTGHLATPPLPPCTHARTHRDAASADVSPNVTMYWK